MSSDYAFKKARDDANKAAKNNSGRRDPSLDSLRDSERAKLLLEYKNKKIDPPYWLKN
ncbi:MAG TPA: hypothetical protein VFM68_00540 [Candidatus Saccharimonadales bacterium]|nr:hypothetical protein [Candidatus Saccharimonadales bacterium]